jgi:hypothetical protein
MDGPDDAARVAEKILDRLGPPFDIDGQLLATSFSIGIALFPDDGKCAESLMKNADTAMYHAKESGRNTYRFFDEVMNINALERLQLENALRQALDNQEFCFTTSPRSIWPADASSAWKPCCAGSMACWAAFHRAASSPRRGMRADRADRALGSPPSLPPGKGMAGAGLRPHPGGRQSVGHAVSTR